jgi:hypothetical protein
MREQAVRQRNCSLARSAQVSLGIAPPPQNESMPIVPPESPIRFRAVPALAIDCQSLDAKSGSRYFDLEGNSVTRQRFSSVAERVANMWHKGNRFVFLHNTIDLIVA